MNNPNPAAIEKTGDFFELSLTSEQINNKRTAVRYIRNDITAQIDITGFFNSSTLRPVDLLDISSKGAAIKCSKPISLKKKIILNLLSEGKTIFKISAKFVYNNQSTQNYGLKFDQFNNKLGDFLVSSEHDLVFK